MDSLGRSFQNSFLEELCVTILRMLNANVLQEKRSYPNTVNLVFILSDQSRKGDLLSTFCKIWDSDYFEILRRSILRIGLVIRLKGGWNQFFGPKFWPKSCKFAQNSYLANCWLYKVEWPFKMTVQHDLLWVF